jgi:hypothetical protein
MSNAGALDQLQPVHELNRAFLGLVQDRALEGRECLGLPPHLRRAIAGAGASLLEGVACFPRALFRADIQARSDSVALRADFDEAEHDLCLSVLLAARYASRNSAYQARLLFGLEARDIERLRKAPLTELQQQASLPGVLQCAFCERHWFWPGLLTATRPELRRQLTLMALQPGIALGWPQRRPPHASA